MGTHRLLHADVLHMLFTTVRFSQLYLAQLPGNTAVNLRDQQGFPNPT